MNLSRRRADEPTNLAGVASHETDTVDEAKSAPSP